MLKACYDCLAAGTRREESEVYGTQLNGNSWRTPLLWPLPKTETEKMYLLPKALSVGDRINVTCMTANNPERISIGLVTGNSEPDYNNIASQVELHFPSNKTVIKTVVNGREDEVNADLMPTDLISEKSNSLFTVRIKVVENNNINEAEFEIDETHIETISIKHNIGHIKYIIVDGDVTKVHRLNFDFA